MHEASPACKSVQYLPGILYPALVSRFTFVGVHIREPSDLKVAFGAADDYARRVPMRTECRPAGFAALRVFALGSLE